MNTETQIKIYELNGNDIGVGMDKPPVLSVKNVQLNDRMVFIEIDGKKAKVLGHELIRAIQNATL